MKRISVSVLGSLVGIFFMTVGTAHATPIAVGSITSPVGGSSSSVVPGADPVFDFSFTGGGISAVGSVDTNPLLDGNFVATSGSITITGGVDAGVYTLPTCLTCPAVTNSKGNAGWIFQYDDQVLQPADSPSLDVWGLFFTNASGTEINLWNNGTNFTLAGITEGTGNTLDFSVDGAGSLTPVPEPASMALLGSGLLMMVRRRRRRA